MLYGVDAVHGARHRPRRHGLPAQHRPRRGERPAARRADRRGRRRRRWPPPASRWDFAPVVAVPQRHPLGAHVRGLQRGRRASCPSLGAAFIRGLQKTGRPCSADVVWPRRSTSSATAARPGARRPPRTSRSTRATRRSTRRSCGLATCRRTRRRSPPGRARSWSRSAAGTASRCTPTSYLLTDVLKGELGFDGFVVSDWAGIDQIPGDYAERHRRPSINAGIDMVMVPVRVRGLHHAASPRPSSAGEVPRGADRRRRAPDPARQARVGLFELPFPDEPALADVGSADHRALARAAVQAVGWSC